MNAKRWIHASPMFIQFDLTSPQKSGKKECIRAIEESASYVSYGHLKIIEALLNHSVQEIIFTGGAAEGFLWPQILCDVLGIKIKVPVVKESTSLGTAICAAIGIGKYKNIHDATKKIVKIEQTYSPDNKNHRQYMRSYKRWKRICAEAVKMVGKGLVRPLWRPPEF